MNRASNMLNQLDDNIQGVLRPRTNLLQLYTNNVEEGPRLISDTTQERGIPIMVIIDNAEYFNLKLNVPNGLFTLQQHFG